MSRFVIAVCVLGGCASPDPAPDDLDGIARFLFRAFDDEPAMIEAVGNLLPILEREGRAEGLDGWVVNNLESDDTHLIDHPTEPPLSEMLGVAVTHVSPHPIAAHGDAVLEADQRWLDPVGYVSYQRELVQGGDDFSGKLEPLETHNSIEKGGPFGIVIPFEAWRGFRWVPQPSGAVLVGMGGMREPACSENGKNCILQSFALEVFAPVGEQTLRLNAVWGLVETEVDAFLSEEAKIKLSIKGVQTVFESSDTYLGETSQP